MWLSERNRNWLFHWGFEHFLDTLKFYALERNKNFWLGILNENRRSFHVKALIGICDWLYVEHMAWLKLLTTHREVLQKKFVTLYKCPRLLSLYK